MRVEVNLHAIFSFWANALGVRLLRQRPFRLSEDSFGGPWFGTVFGNANKEPSFDLLQTSKLFAANTLRHSLTHRSVRCHANRLCFLRGKQHGFACLWFFWKPPPTIWLHRFFNDLYQGPNHLVTERRDPPRLLAERTQ